MSCRAGHARGGHGLACRFGMQEIKTSDASRIFCQCSLGKHDRYGAYEQPVRQVLGCAARVQPNRKTGLVCRCSLHCCFMGSLPRLSQMICAMTTALAGVL